MPSTPTSNGSGRSAYYAQAMERLVPVVQELSLARELDSIMAIVRRAARELTKADGATFVLREDNMCFYADEDAIAPLWKGSRFPMNVCISGWAMLNRQSAVIEDIYADARIPHDAYRCTFVKSLAMVPIRALDPIGAIGVYWARQHYPSADEVRVLETLADTTAVALENVRVYTELEQRVRDRTAELEAANSALESFSDRLLHEMPGTVYRRLNDKSWTIKYVSEKCRELTGYAAEELIDSKVVAYGELMDPEDRRRARRDVQAAISEDRDFELEYRITALSGDEKFVRETGRAIKLDNGEIAFVEGFLSDITSRRELESELSQLQKMESLGQLTGGVAHDFNNLLTIVIGNLEMVGGRLDSEDAESLREAVEAAWRGAELSQRLLAFSRRQMLAPEITRVDELIRGMASLLRRTLGGAIEIGIDLADTLQPVLVDPSQLENAILNLAINARDAMPAGGRLSVRAAPFRADKEYAAARPDVTPGRYVMIEVSDTGSGMPAHVRDRAFEPFFTTKETGKGTGLGLSMVYGFLKQSGGHATIYSETGHGTSVRLYVPEAGEADLTDTYKKLSALETDPGESEQVLVVEDDDSVRRVLTKTLQALGYRTLEADSGPAALELLESQGEPIDLLLTDVIMPRGMSGVELAERATQRDPELGVLLTSGFSEQQAAGGSQFPLLTKPYSKVEVAQAVRRALKPGLGGPR